ncbi:MAG: ferrochelatase [Nevskiales bacterium]
MSTAPTGVLLVNLGTPSKPEPAAIRRWLRAFLLDRRVVNLPRLLWWPILFGLILPFRPKKLVHAYQSIWTEQGSPLQVITDQQVAALQAALADTHQIQAAMTYGEPSIANGIAQLEARDCKRIIVLPLYPQYSDTTTAAVFDQVAAANSQASIQRITDYHDDLAYIDALANSIRKHWELHGRGDKLLLSLHGIPERNVEQGDPYKLHCEATARLLAESLGLQADEWLLAYQSRVGRARWLQPYTEETLTLWGKQGINTVDVICPGFAADCLETLEEIAIRNRETFIEAGGKDLRYIPALNATSDHIDCLAGLIRKASA